jgi:hypothetical protein
MLTSTCKGDSNLDRPKCPYSMSTTTMQAQAQQTIADAVLRLYTTR